jgi:hypothetical protein
MEPLKEGCDSEKDHRRNAQLLQVSSHYGDFATAVLYALRALAKRPQAMSREVDWSVVFV